MSGVGGSSGEGWAEERGHRHTIVHTLTHTHTHTEIAIVQRIDERRVFLIEKYNNKNLLGEVCVSVCVFIHFFFLFLLILSAFWADMHDKIETIERKREQN